MKFIRDIISEKRSVKSASMSPPSALPNSTVGLFEDLALSDRHDDIADPMRTIDASGHHSGIMGSDGIATQRDADGQLSAYEMNIFANGDTAQTVLPQAEMHPDGSESAQIDYLRISGPEVSSANGKLHLDVGSLRGTKPPSLFDRPKDPEVNRNDANVKVPSGHHLPLPTEEARIRSEVMNQGGAIDHVSLPIASGSIAEIPFPAAEALENGHNATAFTTTPPTGRSDGIVPDAGIQVPPPAAGRGANRSVRVKTRLLGFNPEAQGVSSPFDKETSRTSEAFPVGWLIVVAGPGRGASFPLHDGVARIGRGEDQTVCLNFGDNSISRENHVSVAFDSELNGFFIGQSGRSNIVRLNNKPLLSTEQVRTGDQIRVGETTLRLVALCGEGFSWATNH